MSEDIQSPDLPPIEIHTDFHIDPNELERMRTTPMPEDLGQGTILDNWGLKSDLVRPFKTGDYRWGLYTVMSTLNQRSLTEGNLQDYIDKKVARYNESEPEIQVKMSQRLARDIKRAMHPSKISEIPVPQTHRKSGK